MAIEDVVRSRARPGLDSDRAAGEGFSPDDIASSVLTGFDVGPESVSGAAVIPASFVGT